MEALVQAATYGASPYIGYVYPNETVIPWGVLIVVYPYITGLVAGAFIVSSLYHVFEMARFKPVARLSLLTALAFLIFAPTLLLSHLGHPERAFEAIWTPHWTSAFAAFGYVAGFYVILLIIETWFAFREDIIARAQTAKGATGFFYRALALGSYDVSENARAHDHKWVKVLAIIGIPSAAALHGYVGFVFGSVKAREWWASDLMPVIFLLSAVVSGVAMLVVIYVMASKVRKAPVDEECMKGMAWVLWAFLIVTMVVEGLEYVEMLYRSIEGIDMIERLIAGPIGGGVAIQVLGSLAAFSILTVLLARGTCGKALMGWLTSSSVLVLIAVLAMRWNVVIGGQELSKALKGLLTYHPPLLGREGVIWSATLFAGSLILLWIMARLLPPWEPAGTQGPARRYGNECGKIDESELDCPRSYY